MWRSGRHVELFNPKHFWPNFSEFIDAVADIGEQSGHERRAERKRHSNATWPEHDPQPELAHRRHVCVDGRGSSRCD